MLLIGHIAISCVPYWIFVGMSPLFYMKSLHVSLSHFGYYQGIFAIVFAVGSLSFGVIVSRCNHQKMLYVTGLIFVVSFVGLAMVTFLHTASAWLITLAFLPFVIGQIIPSVILYPACLNFIPQSKGRVSAIIQGSRLLLTAASLQVAGYYYEGTFQSMGIIINVFIILTIVSLVLVMKNRELMSCTRSQ